MRGRLAHLAGGVVIVVVAFLVTLKALEYWSIPNNPSATLIKVVGATYGESCQSATTNAGTSLTIKAGNATSVAQKHCDTAQSTCAFTINAGELGDPAPGCPKSFVINWQCGNAPTIHEVNIKPEASGKSVSLTCPAAQ
jgi:hypothetical protein